MTEQDLLAQSPADYMSEPQQTFFRQLLLAQRADLQARIDAESARWSAVIKNAGIQLDQ